MTERRIPESRTLFELPIDPNAPAPQGRAPVAPAIYYRRPTVREAHALGALSANSMIEEIGEIAQACVKQYRGDWGLYECGEPGDKEIIDVLTVEDFEAFLVALTRSSRPTVEEGN